MSNWILQSAKTIGRDHIRNNTVCQDDVKTLEQNGVSVIALSDGCGSAPFAEHGSAVTVDFLCSVLVECFDEIFNILTSLFYDIRGIVSTYLSEN